MSRKGKPFTTDFTFPTALEAVAFFNENRAEGVDPIGIEVLEFLDSIHDYDDSAVFNAQPAFRTHFIAVARLEDYRPWLFGKPNGVVFNIGHERNVEAVIDMWGETELDPPGLMIASDIAFPPGKLSGPAVDFCLRLAASWAVARPMR